MFKKPFQKTERVFAPISVDDDGVPLPSMTQQSAKDECDINNILAKYDKTGLISHVSASVAQYGDFTQVNEYQEALNTVIRSQSAFDDLPSDVRKRFANDPGLFFEFATNPDNLEEMQKLGLANDPIVDEIDTKKTEVSATEDAK